MIDLIKQNSKPVAPATGYLLFYAKDDGKLYKQDSNGTETVIDGTSGSSVSDGKVKVSPTDLTSSYLLSKLIAGNGITLSKNAGANETITISLNQLYGSNISNDSTVTGVTVKDALETLESDTTDKLDKIDPTAQSVVSEVTFEDTITLNTTAPETPIKTLGRNASNEVIEFDNVAAGGQVDSVVGGTGVTIDNTDPINPIINATASALDLQTAYNNSVDPEILTDTTRGALTLRRGSLADTDNVIEVESGVVGTPLNAWITGEGLVGTKGGLAIYNDVGTLRGTFTGSGAAELPSVKFDESLWLTYESGNPIMLFGTDGESAITKNPGSQDFIFRTSNNTSGLGDKYASLWLSAQDSTTQGGEWSVSGNNDEYSGTNYPISSSIRANHRTFSGNPNAGVSINAQSGDGSGTLQQATISLNSGHQGLGNQSTINFDADDYFFTGIAPSSDSAPTDADHLTRKDYVDGLIVGTIQYQGTWDASTNSPDLTDSGAKVQGHYYIVDVAGSTNLDGITDWKVGDWAIFDGTDWGKVDNTNSTVIAGTNIGVVASGNDYTVNVVDNPTFAGDVTIDQTINLTPYVNSTPTINQIWARPNGQRMNGGFGIGVDPVANTISAPNLVLTGEATIDGGVKVRSNTQASTATLTINSDTTDIETITAQAVALSIANPSGTPDEGQTLKIRIKDNATARTITWSGSEWRAIGVTLPTTTTISKTLYIGAIYNSVDTKWDVVAISEEA